MTQKLILPINDMRITASIDMHAYREAFGFSHYGTDLVSASKNRNVYSSGEGEVVATGVDKVCGKALIVVYKEAFNSISKQVEDIVFRYFHMESIAVSKGQKVVMGDFLGEYGNTGIYAGQGKHLHLEADADSENYLYTPTILSSNFLKGTNQGAYSYNHKNNSVKNAMDYLYKKESYPNCQTFSSTKSQFVRSSDNNVPVYIEDNWEVIELLNRYNQLESKLNAIKNILN